MNRILTTTFINVYRSGAGRAAAGAQVTRRNGRCPRTGSPCRCPRPSRALDRTTDSDLLRALRDLPGEFRTAVYLADIEGYPYREIAEMMGTPVGTVMSRLHRGRKKIREQLIASGFGTPRAESSGA